MRLGLVTYMWGATWDVPTLIKNCRETGFEGVELRTEHKHGVELSLSVEERKKVAGQFEEGDVKLMGLGTICEFHSPDKQVLAKNVELAKEWVKLAHDVGASGIKVRPNGLPKEVPVERTLTQIGQAMREVASLAMAMGLMFDSRSTGRGRPSFPISGRSWMSRTIRAQ